MNIATLTILAIIAAAVVGICISLWRRKGGAGNCGCHGCSCQGCAFKGNCGK